MTDHAPAAEAGVEESVGTARHRLGVSVGEVVLVLGLVLAVIVGVAAIPYLRLARDGAESACVEAAPARKAALASVDWSYLPLGWECRTATGEVIARVPG